MVKFVESTKKHFLKMCNSGKLFRVDISGREIYQLYLMAFPDGTNPIFRDPASSKHNCNNCNNFIKRYGNIVSINENGELVTLFGASDIQEPYKTVAAQLDALIKSRKIENVFFETYAELNSLNYERCNKKQETFRLGVAIVHKRYTKEEAEKYGGVKADETVVFNHIHLDLPKAFVNNTGDSIESIMGVYRDKYSVFKRTMLEIPLDVLVLVKDMISQGSLLDGTAHLHSVNEIIELKSKYEQFNGIKENWLWETSYGIDVRVAKFKNSLIGVLCSELAEGIDLNKACESWNKRVDPANYHKATAPITKRQIEEAQKFVIDNGYLESFDRRLATIDDIKASEIKYISSGNGEIAKPITIFDNIKSTAGSKSMKFDGIEEVTIEKFIQDIIPNCTSVEVYLQSKHDGNLVTLTTSKNKDSKQIFKWNNNYSWDFNGNLAGKSFIKEAVRTKGGKVDGVLRFSIMWGEGDASDNSDLDAWCLQPNGEKIGFNINRYPAISETTGRLDVDITQPNSLNNKNIVENITWETISKMPDGVYKFWVNQFAFRGSKGFKAEIEFNGEIYSYEYKQPVNGNVYVAEVTLKNGVFSIKHVLPSTETSKDIWGMKTNTFQKVNLVCLSPNHWDENAVGNKHYFFMLSDAKAEQDVRGFHNENLLPELLTHRKVMEVLGANNKIPSNGNQLSGLGFNSTVKDELIVKLTGSFNRTIKIKF